MNQIENEIISINSSNIVIDKIVGDYRYGYVENDFFQQKVKILFF